MTDPVTNVEIEDVLSSIRRLVSENTRGEARSTARMPEAAEERPEGSGDSFPDAALEVAEDADGGMLLLTPDHRIGGGEAADGEAVAAETGPEGLEDGTRDGTEDAVEATTGPTTDLDELEAEIATAIDAGIETALEDILNDTADAAPEKAAEVAAGGAADADQALQDTANDEEASVEALFTTLKFTHSEPEPDSEGDGSLASRIAELENAVAAREDQWEPDGEGEGDNAGAPVEALNWEDDDTGDADRTHAWGADPLGPVEEVEEAELLEGGPGDSAEDVDEFEYEAATAVEPEVAVAVAVEPELEPEPEPETAVEPAVEPETEDTVAEDEPEFEPADPQLARDLDPDPQMFTDTDSVIDEETLREMVADIVRRELQGTLGERITRNVRKLVRREIHRTLAARGLD